MKILIPNLSIGNFASVVKMVQKVGGTAQLAASPSELKAADKVILAGVGAFDAGMESIGDARWSDALNDHAIAKKRPVLGICLGAQLMCESSEEGALAGLAWIQGTVRRFTAAPGSGLKIPHMGWSEVRITRPNPLISNAGGVQRFYFVHSYYIACRNPQDVTATASYGDDFVAGFARDNIFGVQFHPEKSHRFGMALMKHFVEL